MKNLLIAIIINIKKIKMFDENNETNNYLFKEISFEQKDSIYDEKNFFIDKIFTQSNEKEDIFDLKNENNFDWENSEETNKNLNKKEIY